jgi:hypothetical protein
LGPAEGATNLVVGTSNDKMTRIDLRLAAMMVGVSLLTFATLVETYKLLI